MINSHLFWAFITSHCPPSLNESNCGKKFPFSVANCIADEYTCFTLEHQNGSACPYNTCRVPVANFVAINLEYFTSLCFAFVALQMISVIFATVIMFQRKPAEKRERDWEDLPLHIVTDIKEQLPKLNVETFSRSDSINSIANLRTFSMKESADTESPKSRLIARVLEDEPDVVPHPFNPAGTPETASDFSAAEKPRPSETTPSATAVTPVDSVLDSPGSKLARIPLRVKRSLFVPKRDDAHLFKLPSSGGSSPESSSPLHDPSNRFWEADEEAQHETKDVEVTGPKLPRKVKHVRDDIGAFRPV